MPGFVNIDKPAGITSFDVIRELRKRLSVKMGHLGTLDPMATGVLPVALGHATRLISFLEDLPKTYRARARFGAWSDTQDASGTITRTGVDGEPDPEDLQTALRTMTGSVWQRPPVYSAVHYQGKRLYQLAREGAHVEVAPRQVQVYRFDLQAQGKDAGGWWADLEVECSRGTYIRTLIHDLGQKIGNGAYMESLVRTRVGPFTLDNAVALDHFEGKRILPSDFPFAHWPEILLTGQPLRRILHGNQVPLAELWVEGEVLVKDLSGRLVAVARVVSGSLQPIRVIAAYGTKDDD